MLALNRNQTVRLGAMVGGIAVLTIAALVISQNGTLILLGIVLYFGFLAFSYKWPWLLILLTLLASTNFLFLADINYLPVIHLFKGAQVNLLDLTVLALFLIGVARFAARRTMPVFAVEVICVLAAAAMSCWWGISQHFIDLDIALGGLRFFYAYAVYLSLATMLSAQGDRRRLMAIITAIVAMSLLVQLVEVISRSRLVLPTSTPSFYNQTTLLQVGNSSVPYLWNRAPAFLFLAFFIFLSRHIITRSTGALAIAICIFAAIAATFVRSWLIYLTAGGVFLFLVTYSWASFARSNIVRTVVPLFLAGSLVVIAVISAGLLALWISRFQTLLNIGADGSVLTRIRTAQIFIRLFLESPLLGYGPGSIGVFESLYKIWSTDVGFVASLAGYGLLTNIALAVLLIGVVNRLRMILAKAKDHGRLVYANGLLAFVMVAFISYLFTQNFFFIPPWNYSMAIALCMVDLETREDTSRAIQRTGQYSAQSKMPI